LISVKELNTNNDVVDILAGSHRDRNSIVIFIIGDDGKLDNTSDFEIVLDNYEPYGFCLFKDKNNKLHALVNNKKGQITQVSIDFDENSKLVSSIVNEFKLKTQVEGMVADDENALLYVGEEQTGIFSYDLSNDNKIKQSPILINGSKDSNENIRYDVEGLALLGSKYLIASSQGNFSYAIFDVNSNKYLTSFKIIRDLYDRVEETDGIEICTKSFGDRFPEGILVVQDGFNFDGDIKHAQNFKIVDIRDVYGYLNE